MIVVALPVTALAAFVSIDIIGNAGDAPGNVYAYTYTVGDTVDLRFSENADSFMVSANISVGSLPSALTIRTGDDAGLNPQWNVISGTVTTLFDGY